MFINIISPLGISIANCRASHCRSVKKLYFKLYTLSAKVGLEVLSLKNNC